MRSPMKLRKIPSTILKTLTNFDCSCSHNNGSFKLILNACWGSGIFEEMKKEYKNELLFLFFELVMEEFSLREYWKPDEIIWMNKKKRKKKKEKEPMIHNVSKVSLFFLICLIGKELFIQLNVCFSDLFVIYCRSSK